MKRFVWVLLLATLLSLALPGVGNADDPVPDSGDPAICATNPADRICAFAARAEDAEKLVDPPPVVDDLVDRVSYPFVFRPDIPIVTLDASETSGSSTVPTITPGDDCRLYVEKVYRDSNIHNLLEAHSYVLCSSVKWPDIYLKSKLERARWYGTQTLNSHTNSCGHCDELDAIATWDCTGAGTYTYWTYGYSEVLDNSGRTWSASGNGPTVRTSCS